jgi:two-component system chemotaxis response regulator CheB
VALIVALHMPPVFSTMFAEHLRSIAARPTREPAQGERILPGSIYVVPGNMHLSVARLGGHPCVQLDHGVPVNFCRPSIDQLFASAAGVFGPATLALLMTGMGADGVSGAQSITAAGGTLLAQDAASSVVWGMPGAAMRAGLCSALGDPAQLGVLARSLIRGDLT